MLAMTMKKIEGPVSPSVFFVLFLACPVLAVTTNLLNVYEVLLRHALVCGVGQDASGRTNFGPMPMVAYGPELDVRQ